MPAFATSHEAFAANHEALSYGIDIALRYQRETTG